MRYIMGMVWVGLTLGCGGITPFMTAENAESDTAVLAGDPAPSAPAPALPDCWDLKVECQRRNSCASIGNSSERDVCDDACEAWAKSVGCD